MIKFSDFKKKVPAFINSLKKNPLKMAIFGGLALCLVITLLTLFYLLIRNRAVFPEQTSRSFLRDLAGFDNALIIESPEQLEKRLDSLERQARRLDDWLSILKRRRELVWRDSSLIQGYQKSALEAVKIFPFSEVMIAIAGEALIQGPMEPGSINETRELLIEYANRISQERFITLALSFHVIAGSFADPGIAAEIPNLERFFIAELPQRLRDSLFINHTLLGILNRNADSGVRVNELLRIYPYNENYLRLGGEYFYDYGNPLRAAELFLRLGSDYVGRAADALVLADEIPAARNIWNAIANSPANESPELQIKSFYNLAATSADNNEAISWLEKIFASGADTDEVRNLYSLIRYTRLLDTSRSIEILEEQNLRDYPLLDLELLRRQMDIMPLDRSAAEVWLLLGRHPQTEALYQWGAWYFQWQKLYEETAQLLKIAEHQNMSAPWMDLCHALLLIGENRINEGLIILEAASAEAVFRDWRIPANMARIMESRRSVTQALALYEQAAGLVDNTSDNAVIQFRISRCLNALGRFEEAQRALIYALELDPENLLIRLENQRLLGR